MNKVKIIDSMMGTGKTSFAIQLMKDAEINQNFIYVTPFLDEVQRIKKAVPNRDFKEPENHNGSGTKLESLKRLIGSGEDIVTTHALFCLADKELIDLLRWGRYTLIIDEAMEVVSLVEGMKKDDVPVLLKSCLIKINEDKRVEWISDPKVDTRYNEVRDLALAGNLYEINNALVWNFPLEVFEMFEQVYILTYLFDGQVQRFYFDQHRIMYEYYSVEKLGNRYVLKLKEDVPENRSLFKELIHIYEGNLNEIGDKPKSLSKSWFLNSHNASKVKTLKNNLKNYLRNIQKAKSDKILWTTFKGASEKIKGGGFGKMEEPISNANPDVGKACYTAFNLRATNKYRHKTVLAFCLNRYMHPIIKNLFIDRGVEVNEDLLALSDLLQWVFRSAVRDGKPVSLYVPSRRMRELLIKWLDNEI